MVARLKHRAAIGLVAALAITLTGCLFAPGRFVSALDLRKDGKFAFSYSGEIQLMPLTKGASKDADLPFKPLAECKDAKEGDECSDDSIADQKKNWEEERTAAAAKAKKDAEEAKAFLGGIDPSDPKAAEEFAARLRRQAGWKRVDYKGGGIFDVDFAVAGRLDHDFQFPTIERFSYVNPFVLVVRRADGTVRVDAPAFIPNAANPLAAMMGGMTPSGGDVAKEGAGAVKLDGQFALTTDGTILANNTDEGAARDPAGQKLSWTVNPRTPSAPTALVRLGQ